MKQAYLELSSSLYPASTNYRYAAEAMIEVPTPYGPLSIGLLSSPSHPTLLRERAFHNSAADTFSGATTHQPSPPVGDAAISLPAAELDRRATHGPIFCFLAVQRYGAAKPAE
jgi:hypothetical protein